MDFWDVLAGRHSVRDYRDEPVAHEVVERVLHAAALAPSAQNSQPWHYHIAVGDLRREVGAIMSQATVHLEEYLSMLPPEDREFVLKWFSTLGDAPVIIGVSAPDPESESDLHNTLLSVGASIQNLLLAATAEGLGACNVTFSWWVRDDLARVFRVEDGRSVVSVITLGWPSDVPPVAPKHSDDVADWYE